VATAAGAVDRVPAAGGRFVLEAALAAEATVVGVVGEIAALDDRSWWAKLEIERSLSGDAAPGDAVPIAWEELARDRPRRFDEGDRVLVVLEPLPGWSIWRTRLAGREAIGIARRGEAFLRDPDAESLGILGRLLARAPEARAAAPGRSDLAALVARGAESLARAAVTELDRSLPAGAELAPAVRTVLAAALLDATRPAQVRTALLSWIARRRLEAFRSELEALLAPGSEQAPDAVAALASLDGGLPAQRAEALLARAEPELRAAVLRHAGASLPLAAIEAHMTGDPAPEVRAAAVRALVQRRGVEAFPAVAPLLARSDSRAGAAAVHALGDLGAPVVPPLVEWILPRSIEEARGGVLALGRAGPSGQLALRGLANEHPDAMVRGLAEFLLGRPPRRH